MSPFTRYNLNADLSFPRMRGDEPLLDFHAEGDQLFSPHARG